MAAVLWIIGILAAIFALGWGVEYLRPPAGTPDHGTRIAAANARGVDALRLVRAVLGWAVDRIQGVALILLGLFFLSYTLLEGFATAGWTILLGGLFLLVYGAYSLVD